MAFRFFSRVPQNESWVTEVFGRHFKVLRPGSIHFFGRIRERVPTTNQQLDVSVPAAASQDGLLTNLSASVAFVRILFFDCLNLLIFVLILFILIAES
jgi:regulator of protease activity HflC (stomatin/prohibitin superfamily)